MPDPHEGKYGVGKDGTELPTNGLSPDVMWAAMRGPAKPAEPKKPEPKPQATPSS